MKKILFVIDSEGYYLKPIELWVGELEIPPIGVIKVKPPATEKNQIQRWNGECWEILPDFRGTEYWPADAKHNDLPITIDKPGIAPPDDALFKAPAESLEQRIEKLRAEVTRFHSMIKERFVPPHLSDLYQIKRDAADNLINADKAALPAAELSVLEPEAIIRGIEVTELAEIIITKNNEARSAVGVIEAARVWANDVIETINDEPRFINVLKILADKKLELSRRFGIDSRFSDDETLVAKKQELSDLFGVNIDAAQTWAQELIDTVKDEADFAEVAKKLLAKKEELSRQFLGTTS